jgi:hypothetical protein
MLQEKKCRCEELHLAFIVITEIKTIPEYFAMKRENNTQCRRGPERPPLPLESQLNMPPPVVLAGNLAIKDRSHHRTGQHPVYLPGERMVPRLLL